MKRLFFTLCLLAAALNCTALRQRTTMRTLSLQSFPIEASYTEDEKAVPVLFATTPAEPPAAFQLPALPAPGDQGKQASGAAWAAGYLAHSVFVRKRQADFVCSPAFVYNSANGGRDQGIPVMAALEVLQQKGCAPIGAMPYNERDFYRRPSGAALEAAQAFRIRGYARVDYPDIEQIRAHLLQGSVIVVTMKVTENFVQLAEPEWIPAGDFIGIQSLGVIGYDITREQVLLQNSSGSAWGKNGTFIMSLPWFQRLTEKAFVLF